MKKNKDQKNKDNSVKKPSSHQEDIKDSKSSSEFDNGSLNEIKKLADDFSMQEESFDSSEDNLPTNDDSVFDNSEDFLDRLGDLSRDVTKTRDDQEITSDLENRLDKITYPSKDHNLYETTISRIKPEIDEELSDLKEKTDTPFEDQTAEIFSEEKSNEVFLDQLKSSLESDPDYTSSFRKKTESSDSFKTFEADSDDSEIIEDLEQEIVNADQAVNPFLGNADNSETDDFISNLENIKNNEFNQDVDSKISSDQTLFTKQEQNLPSDSWDNLMESTETKQNQNEIFDFDEEDSFEDFLNKIDDIDLEDDFIEPYSLPEKVESDSFTDDDQSQLESFDEDGELISIENTEESEESVDSLRQSFINEFDQSAWEAELAKQNQKKWLPQLIENIKIWFRSLNPGEKILIILSFFISLAVLVAIFLVVTQWSFNQKITDPPPALEAADTDLIYPTGIELPGGWFFFLERGEIKDNRWEPVNAEWLSNTKLRRVVAIPWSNQSEAVIQSLTNSDEISIFMNNNDVVTYQVDEIQLISRENVRVLSDTEPSLVVILFRDDDEDRWAVIAKPK